MGFRKLLARKPAEDPLERLAELGREHADPHHSTCPFPEQATTNAAALASPVAVEKKPVVRREVRRRSYVWLSQKTRESGAWPDQLWRPF